jgi:tetratricopeptide (TPR) repeat protein
MARSEQVVAVLDGLLKRFAQDKEPKISAVVAQATLDRAKALGRMGRQDDQLSAYNDLISRFAGSQELRVRIVVADAYIEKARLLRAFGKTEDQVEACREFLNGFSGDTREELQEFFCDALMTIGRGFATLEKPVEAIAALDELIQVQSKLRWGMPPRRLAEILLCKAKMLELAGRKEEAGAVYQELLAMGAKAPGSILWLIPFSREAREGISRLGYVAAALSDRRLQL